MRSAITFVLATVLLLFSTCNRQKGVAEDLLEEVRLSNLKAPQRVTDGVQFDSMAYNVEANELVYYYTMDDSLYTPRGISEGKKVFRENMLKEMRASIKLKKYKQRSITFRYVYWAKSDARELLNEKFTASDYN